MPEIKLDGQIYQYLIKSSKVRKTVEINVDKNSGLVIYAPSRFSQIELEDILTQKSSWIQDKLGKVEDVKPLPAPKKFVDDEKFLYLGKSYRLRIISDPNKVSDALKLYRGNFILNVDEIQNTSKLKDIFINWYLEKAKKYILKKVDFYSKVLSKQPSDVVFTDFKSKWGSCDPDGVIKYDWRIILAPKEIIDYIIAHELSHLISLTHDEKFWTTLAGIIPDFKEKEEWMRINSNILRVD